MNTTDLQTLPAEQQYKILYEMMHTLCETNNWGDPFSYARSREIYQAIELGHTIGETYSGADAYIVENGEMIKFEYKSTINDKINGSYNGISIKPTLEEQRKYIVEEKIGCYKTHYYSRFDNGKITETWSIPGEVVVALLLPKIEKQYLNTSTKKADPRIGVSMTHTDIKKYGTRIK